ncbi:hypothetical protein GQ53DRAFT_359529 [Thozetella sp. PMI_491]|nr:hypothetical protein GQ53DRAFT_359529 [Thozetella sp. PMI_491]
MAEFLSEITESLSEEGIEDAEIGASSASEVVENVAIDGVDAEVEGGGNISEEAREGMEESKEEVKDVVSKLENGEAGAAEEAEALEKGWAEKFKNVWASAKTFGKFVGVELAKGALFYAGTKLMETIFTNISKAGGSSGASPDNQKSLQITQTINKAGNILQDALDTWSKWQTAHYGDRESFGSVKASGIDIQIFQILQSGVANLGEKRDKMGTLVKQANKDKTLKSVTALLTADIDYAKSVVDLSLEISTSMTAMTNAGLPTKQAEVQAAYDMLMAASA